MNEQDQYIADFMRVFETLERWGPGSEQDTLKALAAVPFRPTNVLDLGCGKGLASLTLATNTRAKIVSLDNEASALAQLTAAAEAAGLDDRISTVCASMTEPPFPAASFDLLWAEGSAYIMGVDKALRHWRPLLAPGGVLVLSDLVWTTENPNAEAKAFWQQGYPDMTGIATRTAQIQAAGYTLLESFSLSREGWRSYLEPLQTRVNALSQTLEDSRALADLRRELAIYRDYEGEFGYQFFVLGTPA